MLSTPLQERIAIRQALRQRCAMATEEFYQKAGIQAPPMRVRYRVEAVDNGWAVVDRATHRLHGHCKSHVQAMLYAQKLEAAHTKRLGQLWSAKWMGEAMTRYLSMAGIVMLVVICAWG